MSAPQTRRVFGEFRLYIDTDLWGTTLHWWFTIADELHFNRQIEVPAQWRFRPSPLGIVNDPDDWATLTVRSLSDANLLRFGRALYRYASKLRAAGVDY